MTGYSAVRFHGYTALGVLLWAAEAALFADRPVLGLLLGRAGALVITVIAAAVGRSTEEVSS